VSVVSASVSETSLLSHPRMVEVKVCCKPDHFFTIMIRSPLTTSYRTQEIPNRLVAYAP
jgi:hypothetical protein